MEENKVMTDNKLIVDGNEYLYEELTAEQKYGVDQIKNLDGLLAQAEFHANQLRAAKQYFHLTLSASFKEKEDV